MNISVLGYFELEFCTNKTIVPEPTARYTSYLLVILPSHSS